LAIIRLAHTTHCPVFSGVRWIRPFGASWLPAHFPRMRPPSSWIGSICHLPPCFPGWKPGGTA